MIVIKGHATTVTALAFSQDSLYLVSAGKDGRVLLTDPPEILQDTGETSDPCRSLCVNSSGDTVAIGTDQGIVRFLCLPSLDAVGDPVQLRFPITGLAFFNQNKTLAVACGDPIRTIPLPNSVSLFDLGRGLFQSLPADVACNMGIRSLAVHPERRLLAWGTDARVAMIWDATRPDALRFNMPLPIRSVAISPDAKSLAVSQDWKITLYDLVDGRERLTMVGHKGIVSSVAFTQDSRQLMSGSWDGTVRFWDVDSGGLRQSFSWPVGRLHAIALSPDGMRAAAGGGEGEIVIWDME